MLLWLDVSAGVAGDMLLGALIDLGVPLAVVQAAVDAALPGAARLRTEDVSRAGLRARRVVVTATETAPPRRTWKEIERALAAAELADDVRERALRVFGRLAEAEAAVHGRAPQDVHFHEVGAVDSIADVVGVCAAMVALEVEAVLAGRLALGAGRVPTEHGDLPVPVPAVLELVHGWPVFAGGGGELATPTGAALVTTLATPGELPEVVVDRVGVGAGTRDVAGRANVVRAVLGRPADAPPPANRAVVIDCNVDDLDPRVWPTVLRDLLAAGADDAWLTPIIMKKGRPAHTLSVLCDAHIAPRLRERVLALTTTIGLRETPVTKRALPRQLVDVYLGAARIRIKVAHQAGRILNVMPEFDDVAAEADRRDAPVSIVLAEAHAAAAAAGLLAGAEWPSAT